MFLYSTKSSQLSFMERYHKETLAKARAHTFPYHRYTQEEINAYNTVNLVHLCIYISENAILYEAGKLVVRSAPYVIIYPEGFYDTKSRKCYTPVNGLNAFYGFDFLQALYIIKSYFESESLFHMDDYVIHDALTHIEYAHDDVPSVGYDDNSTRRFEHPLEEHPCVHITVHIVFVCDHLD